MSDANADLARLREEIEVLDERLVDLIAERVRLARAAGAAKRAAGSPTMDPHREAEVVRHAAARARTADLDDECVRGIFWRIIELSRRVQQESR
jgi:chorismate mutase